MRRRSWGYRLAAVGTFLDRAPSLYADRLGKLGNGFQRLSEELEQAAEAASDLASYLSDLKTVARDAKSGYLSRAGLEQMFIKASLLKQSMTKGQGQRYKVKSLLEGQTFEVDVPVWSCTCDLWQRFRVCAHLTAAVLYRVDGRKKLGDAFWRNMMQALRTKVQVEALGNGCFRVPSSLRPHTVYDVDLRRPSCSCPDFAERRQACKHLPMAVVRQRNPWPATCRSW